MLNLFKREMGRLQFKNECWQKISEILKKVLVETVGFNRIYGGREKHKHTHTQRSYIHTDKQKRK